jgi:hypothetical protein
VSEQERKVRWPTPTCNWFANTHPYGCLRSTLAQGRTVIGTRYVHGPST